MISHQQLAQLLDSFLQYNPQFTDAIDRLKVLARRNMLLPITVLCSKGCGASIQRLTSRQYTCTKCRKAATLVKHSIDDIKSSLRYWNMKLSGKCTRCGVSPHVKCIRSCPAPWERCWNADWDGRPKSWCVCEQCCAKRERNKALALAYEFIHRDILISKCTEKLKSSKRSGYWEKELRQQQEWQSKIHPDTKLVESLMLMRAKRKPRRTA